MYVVYIDVDGWKTKYAEQDGVTYRWYNDEPRWCWDIVPWIGY